MSPEALARLHADAFTDGARPWSRDEFASLLGCAGVRLVADPDGFALTRCVAGEAELLTIAVPPDRWGRGVGTSLLARALAAAASDGAQTLFLEVAAGNRRARALYDRAGFVEIGRRREYYRFADGARDDALILSVALPSIVGSGAS
jgi:ribosomal-protein-alanine N-acetyltransferase